MIAPTPTEAPICSHGRAGRRFPMVIAVVCAIALTACAADDPHRRAKTGAAIGAVAGAVIGHQFNSGAGRFVGAAVGAVAGGLVGNYMDEQQRAMEDALADEQARQELEIQRLEDDSLRISVPGEVSFDFDSSSVKPGFYSALNDMARVMREYDRTIIHVVGHTDSIGSADYNLELSERRATNVGQYLAAQGVAADRLISEGRGETEPKADNDTEEGRRLNRRVEIVIKPIVEGEEQQALEPPSAAIQPI